VERRPNAARGSALSYAALHADATQLLQATVETMLTAAPRSEATRAMAIRLVNALMGENHLPVAHSVDVRVSESDARPFYYRDAAPPEGGSDGSDGLDGLDGPGAPIHGTTHGDVAAMLRRQVLRACVDALVTFDAGGDQLIGVPPGALEDAQRLVADVHAFLLQNANVGRTELDTRGRFLQLYEMAVHMGYIDPTPRITPLTGEEADFEEYAKLVYETSSEMVFPPTKPANTLLARVALLRYKCSPTDTAQRLLGAVAAACRLAVCSLLQRSVAPVAFPANAYVAGEDV
jgi:hypothetical protein